jgi:hypothetical protein
MLFEGTHQLDLDQNQGRVLMYVTEYVIKHPELIKTIFAEHKDDMKTFQGVAAQVRGKHQIDKMNP